ncbi:MAG TPA: site-specific DNA-methyltransferase, partial [Methanofastidiosum sp.]|nr:site-specific DNA-methyltransferase [Methanofastidiosum sp.]
MNIDTLEHLSHNGETDRIHCIKDEVLNIDTLEQEKFLDKHITRAKVVRDIGKDIIDFLAQIENFQKRLWEKKKFVLSTDYVISLDRIYQFTDNDFLAYTIEEILKNPKQLQEWEELGFGKIEEKKDLYIRKDFIDTEYKKLPLDTKYFNPAFKDLLLEKLSEHNDLNEILDGLLIKSENWQALNTILEKYKEQIQTIYIDPPFNTGSDFLYKDRYRNSSWLSLIKDRLYYVKLLLKSNGTFYLHLDENANYFGKILLQEMNFQNIQEIIFNTNTTKDEEADLFGYKSFGNRFVLKHNTIFYCFNDECLFNKLWKPNRNTTKMKIGWLDLISKPNKEQPNKIEDLDFFIEKYDNAGLFKFERININEEIFPIGDLWNDIYSFTQSEMRISENISFLTQKPENMIRRILQTSSGPKDIILDFFAGSGTTLAVAQKLKRKWIGVEMADYFNEFYLDNSGKKIGLLGRLKNVLNGDKQFYAIDKKRYSHLSNDINWKGGGFFQYQVLEQYEDTLDN